MGRLLGMRLRRNKSELPPYVRYRLHYSDGERRTVINGQEFVARERVCTKFDLWMLEHGRFRLEMFLVTEATPGSGHAFMREFDARDLDLLVLLANCRALESEHGLPAALPVDCLFDAENNLRGIETNAYSNGDSVAYMW